MAGTAVEGVAQRPSRDLAGRGWHLLRVASVEQLTDDAVAVGFDVPAELLDDFAFVPGQSLTLRRVVDTPDGPSEQRRQYSICAPAGARPRIGVREIPDGYFSSWLVRDVRVGDQVEVQTPGGRFCPDPALLEGGRHLCVAAGSGITPMLSVASTVLANDGEVTLLYGNRTTGSVMFAEELADLKNRYGPQLQLVHVLSREPRDVELFSGRLDADRLRRLLTVVVPASRFDHVWLCGPHEMLLDAQAVLAELGVAGERVHLELFYVDEPPPELTRAGPAASVETSEVTVVLDGLSTTTALPREQSILDGAQAMRSDLPFACKGGVCGTCRARVTDGEVDMRRNYALEPAEVEAGFVLTCQSHPVGDAVTVDFDA
jgi:ring-1,2-phenylacetyl-CoA epoxidase subunit PaaE